MSVEGGDSLNSFNIEEASVDDVLKKFGVNRREYDARLGVIHRLNRFLDLVSNNKWVDLMEKARVVKRYGNYIQKYFLADYNMSSRFEPSQYDVIVGGGASFLFAYHWLKPEAFNDDEVRNVMSLFKDWSDPSELMDSIIAYTGDSEIRHNIVRRLESFFYSLFSSIAIGRLSKDWINDKLDTYTPVSLDLTYKIVTSVLSGYKRTLRSELGWRIGIYGKLGSGKTTLAYYTMYTALRFLTVPHELALEATDALMSSNPGVIIALIKEVGEDPDLRIPGLIADDFASSFSKYWGFESDPGRKEMTISLIKALKISREKLGVILFPADTDESLPKGIRESIDIPIYLSRMSHKDPLNITLIQYTSSKKPLSKRSFTAEISMGWRNQVTQLSGLVIPPALLPERIFEKSTETKIRLRNKVIDYGIRRMKRIEGRKKEKQEEQKAIA